MAKFAASIELPKAKSALNSLRGREALPSSPLTKGRGKGLHPYTPLGALPQTSVIGSRYRVCHGAVPPSDIAG